MEPTTSGWQRLRRVFRLPSTTRRASDELEAELRFHLDGRVEDLMEREGLSREEATREARRRFGDVDDYRRQTRTIDDSMLQRRNRMDLLDTIRRETRHAVRALALSPAFSLVAVLTLSLGLGAATAIFTLLDRVVLRPLPYPNADRLVHIGTLWRKNGGIDEYAISRAQYFYFKQNSGVLADVALYDVDILVVAGDGGHPAERIVTAATSASVFSVIGARAELGHLYTEADETPRITSGLVISHGYWQRRFGGDRNVIGRRIDIGLGGPVEIIGVLAPNASLPDRKPDIWVANHLVATDRPQNNHTHSAIGVLKPGVTIAAAEADIQRVQDSFAADHADLYSPAFLARTGMHMHVNSLRDSIVGTGIARAFWLLFSAVGFVLLIAAANVANLFLVRIDARRREVAVRAALGASRAHLTVHYLAESLLVSTIAALGAVGLASALLHVMIAVAPASLPRLDEVTLDGLSILFCAGAAITFGVIFGLLPTGSLSVDIGVLRDGGRGLTTSRRRDLARRGLVLAQITLAVVLLSGAALMVKSFDRLRNVRPGFDANGVTTMTLVLPPSRYRTHEQSAAFWRELIQRVEAVPGVKRAGATDNLPLVGSFGCTGVVTDFAGNEPAGNYCMGMVVVTPGYFEAMGIPVSGTTPTWSTVESGTAPTIISGVVAKRYWGAENPIGHVAKPFSDKMPAFPIVGVAGDIRGTGLRGPLIDAIYFPLVPPKSDSNVYKMMGPRWWVRSSMTLVVRAPSISHGAVVTAVRGIVGEMDAQVPIADIQPMETRLADSMADTSFTMLLLLIAASVAMVLSAVGIYGVISYIVGQRRVEIGIRMALGAQVREVSQLVVGQSLRLAVIGVLAGVAGALLGTRFLGSLLFEVSPTDPVALGGTALVLLVVAILASLGPTRRAAKINPVEAMRG